MNGFINKILVIDDDELCRQMIVLALEQEGYDMLEAADGDEGIRLARMYLPELILCDVVMDNIDGIATLATLRHERATSLIPFIMMTGKTDRYNRHDMIELGADDFLAKPFHISELLTVVNAHLRKHHGEEDVMRSGAEKPPTVARNRLTLALPNELRNPLNLIIGFAETLEADNKTLEPGEISEMAAAIRESTLHLEQLIGNFLIFSQLEEISPEKAGTPSPEQTPSVEKIMEPIALYKARQSGRMSDLELNLHDLPVAVPSEHLTKILDELLDNAFRYSKSGTPVQAMASAQNKDILISVSNHGKGFSPQQLELIGFTGQTAPEKQTGNEFPHRSGRGLAIAKKLVELYGGGMNIKSNPVTGTTVVVKLPGGAIPPETAL